jgi:hypothetical protein
LDSPVGMQDSVPRVRAERLGRINKLVNRVVIALDAAPAANGNTAVLTWIHRPFQGQDAIILPAGPGHTCDGVNDWHQ